MKTLQNHASVKQFGFLFECCVRVLTKGGIVTTMADKRFLLTLHKGKYMIKEKIVVQVLAKYIFAFCLTQHDHHFK
jgi:hypothetical protein